MQSFADVLGSSSGAGSAAHSTDTAHSTDVADLFLALRYSDVELLTTPRPGLCPNAVVKFRVQFGAVHEGGLVEYAVYRVFEELLLYGRGSVLQNALSALGTLLKVHCPQSLTAERVPFLAGGAYRLAFGRDARLDDYHVAACLREFIVAKNQRTTTEVARTLALTLMQAQLMLATVTTLQGSPGLTDGDRYPLLREAVVQSKGVEWLVVLPPILWPDTRRIPEGICDPASGETLMDVWVDASRSLTKLAILLHTQTPSPAVKDRFMRICGPLMARRLDGMTTGEADAFMSIRQCLVFLNSNPFKMRRAVEKKPTPGDEKK
jgi:hypothetical protein